MQHRLNHFWNVNYTMNLCFCCRLRRVSWNWFLQLVLFGLCAFWIRVVVLVFLVFSSVILLYLTSCKLTTSASEFPFFFLKTGHGILRRDLEALKSLHCHRWLYVIFKIYECDTWLCINRAHFLKPGVLFEEHFKHSAGSFIRQILYEQNNVRSSCFLGNRPWTEWGCWATITGTMCFFWHSRLFWSLREPLFSTFSSLAIQSDSVFAYWILMVFFS